MRCQHVGLAVGTWAITISLGLAQELPFLLYQQSFETGLSAGTKGDLGDTGWDLGNSTLENAGIWHPTSGDFAQTTPLAAPADGNQVLFIDDMGVSGGPFDNTFVAVNTGIVVQEDATYRIAAATGHPLQGIGDQSIQAWVQPPPLDGGIDRRGFIGQSFTTFSWTEAEPGEWIDNEFQFTAFAGQQAFNPTTGSTDLPVVGSQLIILVTNFNSDCCGIPGGQPGIVVWDNFRVFSDVPPALLGDFNTNGILDAADIDLLSAEVRAKTHRAAFDLTGDGRVDTGDRVDWVTQRRKTWFGDANLDGLFNTSDLVTVFQVGEYEDNTASNSGWADGDWNGDGEFDSGDLVTAFQDGGFEAGMRAAVSTIPEPAALPLLAIGICGLLSHRRIPPRTHTLHRPVPVEATTDS